MGKPRTTTTPVIDIALLRQLNDAAMTAEELEAIRAMSDDFERQVTAPALWSCDECEDGIATHPTDQVKPGLQMICRPNGHVFTWVGDDHAERAETVRRLFRKILKRRP